jgi:16S rRNA A1518/A1519 N6-dimethyltransferase RsmA/KsgA/DIM1 with predicted DNA glycosylase/AP lyase activity
MAKFKNHDVTNVRPKNNRDVFDSFYTPPYAVQSLLSVEKFDGAIWECASGMGHISKELEKSGYKVISSDIQDNKVTPIYGKDKTDFLLQNKKVDNIITNPPYNLLNEFIVHGLKTVNKKWLFWFAKCVCAVHKLGRNY